MAANAKDIEIVAKQNADWDRQKSKDLADTWIKQYPDLNAIFCNNDTMALGVVEAVKSSGKDILVVGVDGIGEAYDSIRRGELDATIDSFPFYKAQNAGEVMLRRAARRSQGCCGRLRPSLIPKTWISRQRKSLAGPTLYLSLIHI